MHRNEYKTFCGLERTPVAVAFFILAATLLFIALGLLDHVREGSQFRFWSYAALAGFVTFTLLGGYTGFPYWELRNRQKRKLEDWKARYGRRYPID